MRELLNLLRRDWHLIATSAGCLAGFIATAKGLLELWKYVVSAHEARAIEKSFGADYYSHVVISQSLSYYVAPHCPSIDPGQETESTQILSTREELFAVIDRFLSTESRHRHLLLLADSGMGKTSFVIAYYARNLRLSKKKRRRLAIVPLSVPTALEDVAKIDEKRNTILFLDALDEDVKALDDHRERLQDIMRACGGFDRVLITCRTQFFSSEEEIPKGTGVIRILPRSLAESRVYEFWKLYISPLSNEQIRQFVRKRFPIYRWSLNAERRCKPSVRYRNWPYVQCSSPISPS